MDGKSFTAKGCRGFVFNPGKNARLRHVEQKLVYVLHGVPGSTGKLLLHRGFVRASLHRTLRRVVPVLMWYLFGVQTNVLDTY